MNTWSTMGDYFRALERCLDCPGKDREQFLAQARRMADDFLQGKPDATPDEVAGFLGEPEEPGPVPAGGTGSGDAGTPEEAEKAGQTDPGGRGCGSNCDTLYLSGLVGDAPPSN